MFFGVIGAGALRGLGLCAGALAALVVARGAQAAETPAAPAAPVAATAPLTIKDFLADPTYSHLRLSPSGGQLAMVKTDGETDELRVIDLKSMKAKVLLRTRKALPREVKDKIRMEISYVHWKTETRLVVSLSSPTDVSAFGIDHLMGLPVHFVLSTDDQTKALPINEKNAGKKSATLELSDILDVLRDDPDHLLLTFRRNLRNLEVFKVDVRDGTRVLVEHGDESVVGYGVDRKGHVITRDIEHEDGSLTVQGRAPGETRWSKIFDINKKSLKFLSDWELLGAGPPGLLYVKSRPNGPDQGDTKAVRTYDLKTATLGPVVWSHPKFDVDDVITGEETGALMAGCYWDDV
jgi:hypothetical protein